MRRGPCRCRSWTARARHAPRGGSAGLRHGLAHAARHRGRGQRRWLLFAERDARARRARDDRCRGRRGDDAHGGQARHPSGEPVDPGKLLEGESWWSRHTEQNKEQGKRQEGTSEERHGAQSQHGGSSRPRFGAAPVMLRAVPQVVLSMPEVQVEGVYERSIVIDALANPGSMNCRGRRAGRCRRSSATRSRHPGSPRSTSPSAPTRSKRRP